MSAGPKRWSSDDADLLAVCALLSVQPTPHMAYDFDRLQEMGRFDGAMSIGDYEREWLVFKLQENGRLANRKGGAE